MKSKWKINPPFSALAPLPITMVGCRMGDKENIITVSWIGVMNSEPEMIGIGIRPERYSHDLIGDSGYFTVNVPSADLYREMMLCGTKSGRDVDKWKETRLTKAYGKTNVPMIEECPISIECEVIRELELPSHRLFLGKSEGAYIDDKFCGRSLDYITLNPMHLFCNRIFDMKGQLLGVYGNKG